jgi:hypothetical protein
MGGTVKELLNEFKIFASHLPRQEPQAVGLQGVRVDGRATSRPDHRTRHFRVRQGDPLTRSSRR